LEVPEKALQHVFVDVEANAEKTTTDDVRRDGRCMSYKNKSGTFTNKEHRLLRSIQATQTRKNQRQDKHFAARSIKEEACDDVLQNPNEQSEKESKLLKDVERKSRARREKLNEYLEQRKKLEDTKRKMAKPAFKTGIVHHSLNPNSINKYSAISTKISHNQPTMSTLHGSNDGKSRSRCNMTSSDRLKTKTIPTMLNIQTRNNPCGIRQQSAPKDSVANRMHKLAKEVKSRPNPKEGESTTSEDFLGETADVLSPIIEESSGDMSEDSLNCVTNSQDCFQELDKDKSDGEDKHELLQPPVDQLHHLAISTSTLPSCYLKESLIWFLKKGALTRTFYSYTQLHYLILKIMKMSDIDQNNVNNQANTCCPSLFSIAYYTLEKYRDRFDVEEKVDTLGESKSLSSQLKLAVVDSKDQGDKRFQESYANIIKDILDVNSDIILVSHPLLAETSQTEFQGFVAPALVPGTCENMELYRFLVEVFTWHGSLKGGEVVFSDFSAMIDEVMSIPNKLSVLHSYKELLNIKVHRQQMFKVYKSKDKDKMCLGEWIKFAFEEVYKKMN